MNRRGLAMASGWLLAAVATAAIGTVALDIVGSGILGPQNQPLTEADVNQALASARAAQPPASSTTPVTTAPTTTTPAIPHGLNTPGGSLVAACDGDQVTLLSWSPAQGFRTDGGVARGPAPTASIKFKSGKTEIRVTVSCRNGEPVADTATDDH
ncbi:hypothetical protein [Amycolatopsis taiwanensis]|uniref:hypothetical protein n=1 Tax=Amycolatopsis taiwanensis TaxID=342230 RepID=UPI0012EBD781|nr:hypothetical protein [Amycolatopsis taiwanensis]